MRMRMGVKQGWGQDMDGNENGNEDGMWIG